MPTFAPSGHSSYETDSHIVMIICFEVEVQLAEHLEPRLRSQDRFLYLRTRTDGAVVNNVVNISVPKKTY